MCRARAIADKRKIRMSAVHGLLVHRPGMYSLETMMGVCNHGSLGSFAATVAIGVLLAQSAGCGSSATHSERTNLLSIIPHAVRYSNPHTKERAGQRAESHARVSPRIATSPVPSLPRATSPVETQTTSAPTKPERQVHETTGTSEALPSEGVGNSTSGEGPTHASVEEPAVSVPRATPSTE